MIMSDICRIVLLAQLSEYEQTNEYVSTDEDSQFVEISKKYCSSGKNVHAAWRQEKCTLPNEE